jgi:hypothetical protein
MSSALYEERSRRLLDQVALKETDRVPFVFGTRFWAAKFAGITFEEQSKRWMKLAIRLSWPRSL